MAELKTKTNSYMGAYVRIVEVCQIWSKNENKICIPLASTVIYPAYIFFFSLSALEIYHNWGKLESLTETIDIFCMYGVTFHKYITMFRFEAKYKSMVAKLDSNFSMQEQRTRKEFSSMIEKCIKDSATLNKIWTGMCAATLSSMMLIPWTGQLLGYEAALNTTETTVSFPYRTWTPFDTSSTTVYTTIYVYHIFMGFTIIYMIPMYDMFYFTFVNHICVQFQILQLSLKNLRENTLLDLKSKSGWSLSLPPQLDWEMSRRLTCCILHHEALLEFVEELESIVNPVFLSQFLGSSILFCMTGFQITVSPGEVIKALTMGELLFSAMFELGVFCWFANRVMDESLRVALAAYESEWYHFSAGMKHSIRLIMTRSQRPAKITFGKFAVLSLETFASILQVSYTYFTVLNRLNE